MAKMKGANSMSDTYRGIAPTDVDAWERTVAIYRVARKAGARLRARDLIRPDPERWFAEYAGPYLNRIANLMHRLLEERIAEREIALGLSTPDEDETTRPQPESVSPLN
jgi:hypothetical protein